MSILDAMRELEATDEERLLSERDGVADPMTAHDRPMLVSEINFA